MDVYNISEYITIVRRGLTESKSQGKAGGLLLGQIGDLICPRVDFNDSKITRLVKHQKNVQDDVINFVSIKENHKYVVVAFRTNVENDFNPVTIGNVCHDLMTLINEDPKISSINKKELNDHYKSNDMSIFLAHALIHAVVRDNTLDNKNVSSNDIPYLTETNNHCPLCNKDLIKYSKDRKISYYEITKIFNNSFDDDIKKDLESAYATPKSLNSFENKIALCLDCYNVYRLDPTEETYKVLYEKKRSFEENSVIKNKLISVDVEKELYNIIHSLAILTKDDMAGITELTPKEIINKIPDDYILKDDVTNWVLKYYKYIEKLFSDLDSTGINKFNVIASQVKLAFENLNSFGTLSQRQIFTRLSEWILDKIGYPKESINIVNILVAFFVQNCEVFYAIS